MPDRIDRRIKQLKFIASMFRMSMDEFNNVMGPESIQTIYRLIGESQGKNIEERLRKNMKIEDWTPQDLAKGLIEGVFEPAIGDEQAEISIDKDVMTVILKACPFKQAGIKIEDKFYCNYTEGLIETIAREALDIKEFKSEKLRAVDNCDCTFKITLK